MIVTDELGAARSAEQDVVDTLVGRICQCPTLPSLPAIAIQLLRETGRNDAQINRIAELVAQDAALLARLLRVANSAYYGLRHRITSIPHAITVLGLRNLRVIIAGLGILPAIRRMRATGIDPVACCRRSLYSALAARMISQRSGIAQPDDCFLSGLLMDVSVLAMAEALGRQYVAVVAEAERHADLTPLECERIGVDHGRISSELAARWKLPEALRDPMRYHHHPESAPSGAARQTAKVLQLAGCCADVLLEENPLWAIAEVNRLASAHFGFDEPKVDALMAELGAEARAMGAAFEVPVDESATYSRAQRQANEELLSQDHALDDECRVALRRGQAGRVNIFFCRGEQILPSVQCQFNDVTPAAIGLLHAERIEPGTRFMIGLRRGGQKVTVVMYEVRICKPVDPSDGEQADGGARFALSARLVRAAREREILAEVPAASPLHRLGKVLLRTGQPAQRRAASPATHKPPIEPAAPEAVGCGLNDMGDVSC